MALPQESRMTVESLSQPELLTLLSVLEGELEARDLVIEELRAQCRDVFVQERYGKYNLSDPFLALQRDSEVMRGRSSTEPAPPAPPPPPSPLAVLKLVMSHCKRMQEKMLSQLAAAEHRHRKVIADLEDEKRRHAQDTAEGDDVTCMLEKERERLLQQLGFERAQLKRVEKEQRRLRSQLEEAWLQHKQLSASLANESQRGAELGRRLEEERVAAETLRAELGAERRQASRAEARAEEQLAEFDTQKEQLRAWLRREEARGAGLQAELEELRAEVARLRGGGAEPAEPLTSDPAAPHKLNGHPAEKEAEPCQVNGCDIAASVQHPPSMEAQQNPAHPAMCPSPSLGSSPCSSPLLAKRPSGGVSPSSPSYQASYQAGINQRFHAARHKFQGQPEQDHHGDATPRSPRDLSPNPAAPASPSPSPAPASPSPTAEPASVKQLARHTVTQALSRFTGQQGGAKPPTSPSGSSSPFGTDYRPPAPATASSPVSPGIKSPVIPRGDRGHPPPIPPKKPGLAQTPMSPGPTPRASHFHDLSGSCGLTSSQDGTKEQDLVLSSTS
ncbi:CTTNBP2 N-terminal-like protein [Conger conger]|uniref:CTTNBP2 N-terminal-like protein n=1 Tax=Conger conger TaxID=82655 RepID=UPI002A5A8BFC|nr:CTTNBP2 N-terminal-like protein [Conger conger]